MIASKIFLATASALAVIGSLGLVNAQTSPPKTNAETVQSPQVQNPQGQSSQGQSSQSQSPPPAPDTAQRPGTGSSGSVQNDTRTSPRSGRGSDTMNNSTGPAGTAGSGTAGSGTADSGMSGTGGSGTAGSSGNMSNNSNPALAPRAARADRN